MANATTKLFVAGLLAVLPASAGNPKRGQTAEKSVPDVLVYVEGSERVTPPVLFRAEDTATRMFAGIGVQVQWANRRPVRAPGPASTGCASQRPEEIVIQIVAGTAGSARPEAFASAVPYAHAGVRVTVYYDELREAIRLVPRLEPAVLAHVLVHEITHVLQGVVRHSGSGVMRAFWDGKEIPDMAYRPLEFAGVDAYLIHRGLKRTPSPNCVETASAFSGRE